MTWARCSLAAVVPFASLCAQPAAAQKYDPYSDPNVLPFPCGVGPRASERCDTETTTGTSTGGGSTVQRDPYGDARRSLDQAFDQLRGQLQRSQAERDRRARESRSDSNDDAYSSTSSSYSSTSDYDIEAAVRAAERAERLGQMEADSILRQSEEVLKQLSADCIAQMSTYTSGPQIPSPCLTDLERMSTYSPGRVSAPSYSRTPETVIDGSKIPSLIEFPGSKPSTALDNLLDMVAPPVPAPSAAPNVFDRVFEPQPASQPDTSYSLAASVPDVTSTEPEREQTAQDRLMEALDPAIKTAKRDYEYLTDAARSAAAYAITHGPGFLLNQAGAKRTGLTVDFSKEGAAEILRGPMSDSPGLADRILGRQIAKGIRDAADGRLRHRPDVEPGSLAQDQIDIDVATNPGNLSGGLPNYVERAGTVLGEKAQKVGADDNADETGR